MAFIPATNVAQVKFIQSMHGQQVTNQIYVQGPSPWDAGGLQALAQYMIEWWNDHLAPNLSNQITLQSVQARDMTVEEGPGVEIAAPALSGGDKPEPALPGNAALAVKLVTGLTGRNRRGRVYVAGIVVDEFDGNAIDGARRQSIQDAFNLLRAELAAANTPQVVASFYNGTELVLRPNGETRKMPIPRETALITPLETVVVEGNIDSQRRRLHGRGV